MNSPSPFEQALTLALQLSPVDRVRLVRRIAASLEQDLAKRSTPSLYGVLADAGPSPSADDIDEARREMWGDFPRSDIADWSLTPEQTLFMLRHHNDIQSAFAANDLDRLTLLSDSKAYIDLFGVMRFDEAYDRYLMSLDVP